MYVFNNLRENLSLVTLYLATKFNISPNIFLQHFLVYTPIGDSILAKRVYPHVIL